MACHDHIYSCMSLLLMCALLCGVRASESTKTLDFDVKPGGVFHSFSGKIKNYECIFTYVSQGGTNEQWQMSVGLTSDEQLFSCTVLRPQGKSYLFFTHFKVEMKGAKIKHTTAYSQSVVGQREEYLKEEEYIVSESTVIQRDGKFRSALSKITVIGQTHRDEL